MRIAFFTETFLPRSDGVVTRLIHTLEELHQAGDEVLVIAPGLHGIPATYQGAKVIGLPSMPFPFYEGFSLGSPILTRSVKAALLQFQPEVIHAVNPVAVGLAAVHYANRNGLPLVASFHTNIPAYAGRYGASFLERPLRRYLRYIHNKAHLNLCTSHTMQTMLQAQGVHSVELWEPGVDADLFNPQRRSMAWRNRLTGGRPEKNIMLYVGRLAPEKGLEKILAVLPRLKDCHMAFVGDGPQAQMLRQAAEGMPVTFLGALYGEELAAAYASADIFVFPSSTETLGLVAIEAMASGLPVVGARRGGLLDLIVDGETGFFFEPESLEDFACKLDYLMNHPSERGSIGQAARRRAEQWSWSAATAGLRQKYAALIGHQEVTQTFGDMASRERTGEQSSLSS